MGSRRRKFHELLDSDPRAARAIVLIGTLYRIERDATEAHLTPERRLQQRRSRSRMVLKRLKKWLSQTTSREPPSSALAQACAYTVKNWEALRRFLVDGRLVRDNNHCERQVRDVAVGRKNYRFGGYDEGARRGAIIYSLLRTCALNDVEPVEYVRDVLMRLAEGWPQSRIDELLPAGWVTLQQAENPPQPEVSGAVPNAPLTRP